MAHIRAATGFGTTAATRWATIGIPGSLRVTRDIVWSCIKCHMASGAMRIPVAMATIMFARRELSKYSANALTLPVYV